MATKLNTRDKVTIGLSVAGALAGGKLGSKLNEKNKDGSSKSYNGTMLGGYIGAFAGGAAGSKGYDGVQKALKSPYAKKVRAKWHDSDFREWMVNRFEKKHSSGSAEKSEEARIKAEKEIDRIMGNVKAGKKPPKKGGGHNKSASAENIYLDYIISKFE